MKKEVHKIAESQRSFIYLELDELYTGSHLPDPLKQEIYQEFKLFLEGTSDTSSLTNLTDAVFELSASREDRFSDLVNLKNTYVKKHQVIRF